MWGPGAHSLGMFEIQNQVAGGLMEEVRSDQGDVLACFSKARGQVWLEQRSNPVQMVGLAGFWCVVKMEPLGWLAQ